MSDTKSTKSKIMHEGNTWDIVMESISFDTACELEHELWHDHYWNIISSQIDEDIENV
jgi:hypothetical protein